MRALLLLAAALLLQASAAPPLPRDFRLLRPLRVAAGAAPQACAVLDATVYAHAAPALNDVRLFAGSTELPYALTVSETSPVGDVARVLNAGVRNGRMVFDLAMPARPYTDVLLRIDAHDFLATATVTGSTQAGDARATALGTFTLFDLTGRGLGRNLHLPLAESNLPFLHVELALSGVDGHAAQKPDAALIVGAEVPPSREAQTLYTTMAEGTEFTQRGRQTIATLRVPAHVPVERVAFSFDPKDRANFSREVRITAESAGTDGPAREQVEGTIARVHLTEAGHTLEQQTLAVPAVLGVNAAAPATVEVAIENGDDRPLRVQSVQLQMRERRLCFEAGSTPQSDALALYYGDPGLHAPEYDYARLFSVGTDSRTATLGAEQPNPAYVAQAEPGNVLDHHPRLIWAALLAVLAALGFVAFRSAKKV